MWAKLAENIIVYTVDRKNAECCCKAQQLRIPVADRDTVPKFFGAITPGQASAGVLACLWMYAEKAARNMRFEASAQTGWKNAYRDFFSRILRAEQYWKDDAF